VSFISNLVCELTLHHTSIRVWQNTADANGVPLKPLPESGFIGPGKWT